MRDNLRKVSSIIVLLMLALGAVSPIFQRHRAENVRQIFADTHHLLHRQGSKFGLGGFNFHLNLLNLGREQTLHGLKSEHKYYG